MSETSPERVEQEPEPLYWEHRGRLSSATMIAFGALVLGFAIAFFFEWREAPLTLADVAFMSAGLLVLGAVFAFITMGPFGPEFKHVRVDARGLWVGRRLIPAHEIGRVEALTQDEATWAATRWRRDGVKIGRGTYGWSSDGTAVLVVRNRPDLRRPGMVVATKDPEALVAALRTLKAGHEGAS